MRSKIFKPVNTLVLKKDHIPPANSEIIHHFFMPAFFVELVTSLTKLAYRLLTETAITEINILNSTTMYKYPKDTSS